MIRRHIELIHCQSSCWRSAIDVLIWRSLHIIIGSTISELLCLHFNILRSASAADVRDLKFAFSDRILFSECADRSTACGMHAPKPTDESLNYCLLIFASIKVIMDEDQLPTTVIFREIPPNDQQSRTPSKSSSTVTGVSCLLSSVDSSDDLLVHDVRKLTMLKKTEWCHLFYSSKETHHFLGTVSKVSRLSFRYVSPSCSGA